MLTIESIILLIVPNVGFATRDLSVVTDYSHSSAATIAWYPQIYTIYKLE